MTYLETMGQGHILTYFKGTQFGRGGKGTKFGKFSKFKTPKIDAHGISGVL